MKNSVLDRLKSYFDEYFSDATKPTARNLFLLIAQEKGEQMQTKIDRIKELSKENRNRKFVSLYHLINEQLLLECYWEPDPDKATGIDEADKELYGENVSGNIMELVDKLKDKSCQPKPTKRVYVPKDNGDKRPLGILSLEGKMVQMAPAKIIVAIYEPIFLDCMYGFRPGRGCHDALRALNWVIEKRKTQWVLDADIKSCFDRIPHKRLLDCLKVKIKDPDILWLVKKYLKAGVMEDGNTAGQKAEQSRAEISVQYWRMCICTICSPFGFTRKKGALSMEKGGW